MTEDRTGRLWVGTPRGLITIMDGVFSDPLVAKQLRGEAIWSLLADRDGTLWIGAESGLFRLRDGKLSHIVLGAETPSAAIYKILDDGHEAMWISGPTRVLRINKNALNEAVEVQARPPSHHLRNAKYGCFMKIIPEFIRLNHGRQPW